MFRSVLANRRELLQATEWYFAGKSLLYLRTAADFQSLMTEYVVSGLGAWVYGEWCT